MAIEKFKTGIAGLDALTSGGLPRCRTTLVAGGPGTGKTLFMISILVRSAIAMGQSAVIVTMEESPRDIIDNATSIGLDLQKHLDEGQLWIEYIGHTGDASEEIGAFNLEGLFIRVQLALQKVKAKFLALDTIETLFLMFNDARLIRSELHRLLNRLSDQGITTVMSGEAGQSTITRRGLEEYVSDCVIALENSTENDIATRKLRVVKYRGGEHGANKYPFLLDDQGFTVVPMSGAYFNHSVSTKRLSTGTASFDKALDGGIRVGSTSLIAGNSGSGKSTLAGHLTRSACLADQRVLYMNFEESPHEFIVNMEAAGVSLTSFAERGKLKVVSTRPTTLGLEGHLVSLYRQVETHQPDVVVIDPISSLARAGSDDDVYKTTIRMVDFLKRRKITALITLEVYAIDDTAIEIVQFASILDTFIQLTGQLTAKGYDRYLQIIKARGIAHDHRKIQFWIGDSGLHIGAPTRE